MTHILNLRSKLFNWKCIVIQFTASCLYFLFESNFICNSFYFDVSSMISIKINNPKTLKFHRYKLCGESFTWCLLLSKQLINWEFESFPSWVVSMYRVKTLSCIIALEESIVRSLEWMWEKQDVKCLKALYPHILVLVTTKTINK